MPGINLNVGFQHELNASQELTLAPQLLQWLRLLQASTTDLSALVQTELESNPSLEADFDEPDASAEAADEPQEWDAVESLRDEFEPGLDSLGEKLEYLAEIDEEWRHESSFMAGGGAQRDRDMQEHCDYVMNSITRGDTLQEHLSAQLRISCGSEFDFELGGLIIGSLDARGYLVTPVQELAALQGAPAAHAEATLETVQSLEPAGVGARDLRECLVLQLRARGSDPLALRLVSDHLHALAQQQYRDLALLLGVEEEAVRQAAGVIRSLDPAPGLQFASQPVEYVEPDVVVRPVEGGYAVELTDRRIPRLRLSSSCRRLIEQKRVHGEDAAYVRRKMRAAMFMIQGITQRQATLKKTMEQVVEMQREYFDRADGQLNALTMARVAQLVGVHETTISRAIANKYAQTPRGLFPIRHFFRAGFRCADGSRMTPERAKELLAETVGREDPCSPLLDRDIVAALRGKGLRIARRTVAKYREELGIPSSKERQRTRADTPPRRKDEATPSARPAASAGRQAA